MSGISIRRVRLAHIPFSLYSLSKGAQLQVESGQHRMSLASCPVAGGTWEVKARGEESRVEG